MEIFGLFSNMNFKSSSAVRTNEETNVQINGGREVEKDGRRGGKKEEKKEEIKRREGGRERRMKRGEERKKKRRKK